MRAIITGQVGMDKKPFLQRVVQMAGERGEAVQPYHVGDMMYAEARDVRPGAFSICPSAGSIPSAALRSRTSSPTPTITTA